MIYFLKREDGDIKIGTTVDYPHRLHRLTQEHGSLILLGAMDGDEAVEKELHLKFKHLRRGLTEFFHPAEELLAFIEVHTDYEIPAGTRETGRINLYPDTFRDFGAFRTAMGLTQSGAIAWLLNAVKLPGETAYEAGDRIFKETVINADKEQTV